jgi:DNA recombination protein RmuC
VTDTLWLYAGLIFLFGFLLGGSLWAWQGRRWAMSAAQQAVLQREPEVAALREQRDALIHRSDDLISRLDRLERERAVIEQRLAGVSGVAAERKSEVGQLTRRLAELEVRHDQVQKELLQRTAECSALQASMREQRQSAIEKLAVFEQSEQRLRESFQNLANQILDAKTERFREQSAEQLGGLLDPLKLQLKEFREAVTQTHASEQRERGMLAQEIRSLKELNQRISEDAINLTRALRGDSRTQGAWGEMVLERVLEASGLQAGREYEVQASFSDEAGNRQRPDVLVRLPEDKVIVIDSKVSLVAWERAVTADEDGERQAALKDHVLSLRRHIDGLSGKNYAGIQALNTLDFVLLFVPIEAAFIEAVRIDENLYTYALAKNISLVSPSTLLATLRTVAHLWRIERRNVNAVEIARRAANLHDNFCALANELENVGQQLEKASGAHAAALRRLTAGGKGSVMLQVQSLAEMGAPVRKSLPARLRDEAAGGADADESDAREAGAASNGISVIPVE